MTIDGHAFAEQAQEILRRVVETQRGAIRSAAEIVARVIRGDGVMHVFGTGHSRAFAMELAGRAGGLVPMNMIAVKDLAMRGGWPPERILDPTLEREPSVARALWDLHRIEPRDGFVIASNSGANGAIVEMARLAKDHGLPVIAVTSLAHTTRVTSNHPSGQRLFEVADLAIDNGAPYGDALLSLPGGGKICAVSSMSAALIGQMIVADTADLLLRAGDEVPVLISVNVPGGEEHNRRLQERYEGRVMRGEP